MAEWWESYYDDYDVDDQIYGQGDYDMPEDTIGRSYDFGVPYDVTEPIDWTTMLDSPSLPVNTWKSEADDDPGAYQSDLEYWAGEMTAEEYEEVEGFAPSFFQYGSSSLLSKTLANFLTKTSSSKTVGRPTRETDPRRGTQPPPLSRLGLENLSPAQRAALQKQKNLINEQGLSGRNVAPTITASDAQRYIQSTKTEGIRTPKIGRSNISKLDKQARG